MTAPDVVYVLGPDSDPSRAELRYSLRSLRNVPHGRVWLVGAEPPAWVDNIEHVAVARHPNRFVSSTMNLRAACEHPDVAEEFLLLNDDFYVMSPVERIPAMHRGYCDDVARKLQWAHGRYTNGLRATRDLCRSYGVENPLCYEVHAPMPIVKATMGQLLASDVFTAAGGRASEYHGFKRTIYGNVARLAETPGCALVLDPKVTRPRGSFDPGAPYLSTSRWWPTSDVAKHISSAFCEPGPYEK